MWTVSLIIKSKKGEDKREILVKDRFHYIDLTENIKLGCDEELWISIDDDRIMVDQLFLR